MTDSQRTSAAPAAGAPPVIRFSLLYQLRNRACSLTARNSGSPQRPPSRFFTLHSGDRRGDCTAHSSGTSHSEAGAAASPDFMTSPPHCCRPTSSDLFSRPSSSAVALMPSPTTHTTAPLLSTMDKRELSKVVVRDAVFGRLLDLVPSRQHIQTAVWTLSSNVIQIDGAVTVCAMPRDARNADPFGTTSRLAASRDGSSASACVEDLCNIVGERVGEIVTDARLFACLLQPYLGVTGCQGDVIETSIYAVV
ncbi:hypothetical protein JKF63_02614 [Porcisia hertigi]|uniref:Uncharacterized protein n=1 Tax=Porcisia hertigi TaxID=2761500 RepID=A0A836L3Z6_9TRYP|nr:hypothetical protein JKF63_02614 [Porcisia hertigi]